VQKAQTNKRDVLTSGNCGNPTLRAVVRRADS